MGNKELASPKVTPTMLLNLLSLCLYGVLWQHKALVGPSIRFRRSASFCLLRTAETLPDAALCR